MPALEPTERVHHAAMLQSWCDLTFLHWAYPVESVQRLVPSPLQVESFGGSAWVGVTPFDLRGLRPLLLPPLPWISHFPETNCRTYVRGPDGHSGVWFFSLDAGRAAAALAARLGYGLPYSWAQMSVEQSGKEIVYRSKRIISGRTAGTHIVVVPGAPIEPQPLDVFLTARFRLYSFVLGNLTYTSVEHPPWPLRSAQLIKAEQTLTAAAGLPDPQGSPMALFSPGVRVRVGLPEIVKAS